MLEKEAKVTGAKSLRRQEEILSRIQMEVFVFVRTRDKAGVGKGSRA